MSSFVSPYIPTTTAAATRAADVVSVTGTNFSPWFNASEGTFVAEVSVPYFNTARAFHIAGVDAGNTTDNILTFFPAGSGGQVSSQSNIAGVPQYNITAATTATAGARAKVASTYKAGSQGVAVNGGAVSAGSAASIASGITALRIGDNQAGARQLNGYLSRLVYYPKRLPDNVLRGLTS